MDIEQETLPDQVYRLAPHGRLDAVTVIPVESAFDQQVAAGHVRLVIDLTHVTYISSSGLRALLRVRRQAQAAGGDVALCAMHVRVAEVFEMIGFNNLFRIFPDVTTAAAALTTVTPA